jgi:pSer/pThr/pTyr-binding forkhead associated (FHA) protein
MMDQGKGTTIAREESPRLGVGALLGKKAVLVILSAAQFGEARVVDQPALVVGRSTSCHFQIHDPLASAEHCRIVGKGQEGFFIEDMTSNNGTFLNARKVTQSTRLQYGDRVVVGATVIRFFLEETLENK